MVLVDDGLAVGHERRVDTCLTGGLCLRDETYYRSYSHESGYYRDANPHCSLLLGGRTDVR